MASDALPVAVIGVGGIGRQTLQALKEIKLVEVVAIADRDPSVAEQVAKEADVPAFTDNRSLLAEARPKAIYAAIPPASCPELISACAQRGIHVWTELPLARDLAEGLMLVRRMEKAGLKLAVGTQRRFAGGYRKAWEIRRRLGPVFLARAHYLFNWGPNLGWRGDKASAGGGALMELGYHAVDLLVWFLGLPEEVYGFSAGGHRPKAPDETGPLPVYDTDDTAAAIVRYRDGAMASVVTTRSSGPISDDRLFPPGPGLCPRRSGRQQTVRMLRPRESPEPGCDRGDLPGRSNQPAREPGASAPVAWFDRGGLPEVSADFSVPRGAGHFRRGTFGRRLDAALSRPCLARAVNACLYRPGRLRPRLVASPCRLIGQAPPSDH